MYPIREKTNLCDSVTRIVVEAPLIAAKAQPGQFVILRAKENSERLPLTIADCAGDTITLIYQIVGAGTMELNLLGIGDVLHDLVGSLGEPTRLKGLHRVCVIGGGVGCAIAYPVAKKMHELGATVHTITGFRSSELAILCDEFATVSDHHCIVTDDGTLGEKGFVTTALKKLLDAGQVYDEVFAVGPLVMMRAVCELTRPYGVPTTVSMNPIMIDGTGMCGGCRLTVGGETKFACVDGPDFDGHQVDFEEAISRSRMYAEQEQHAREKACRLLMKGETTHE